MIGQINSGTGKEMSVERENKTAPSLFSPISSVFGEFNSLFGQRISLQRLVRSELAAKPSTHPEPVLTPLARNSVCCQRREAVTGHLNG